MLHKMLIFKRGIDFDKPPESSPTQCQGGTGYTLFQPCSNLWNWCHLGIDSAVGIDSMESIPVSKIFKNSALEIEKFSRNRVGIGSGLGSMPTWNWVRRWNQFHGIDAKFLKSLKIRPLVQVVHYTDKCPIKFWIWPVVDSNKKLLEVYLFYIVFGYTYTV